VNDGTVRLILDSSAVLAFANESQAVGELIAEVTGEDTRFAIHFRIAVQAFTRVKGRQRQRLVEYLATRPQCALQAWPEDSKDWALWVAFYGRPDLAAARVDADRQGAYILTTEPDSYRVDGQVPDNVITLQEPGDL